LPQFDSFDFLAKIKYFSNCSFQSLIAYLEGFLSVACGSKERVIYNLGSLAEA
jgi:hypothetical protein